MKKTRKIIVIALTVIAACAACFLAYRFTLMTVHGKSYQTLREKVLTVTPAPVPPQPTPDHGEEQSSQPATSQPSQTMPEPPNPKVNPDPAVPNQPGEAGVPDVPTPSETAPSSGESDHREAEDREQETVQPSAPSEPHEEEGTSPVNPQPTETIQKTEEAPTEQSAEEIPPENPPSDAGEASGETTGDSSWSGSGESTWDSSWNGSGESTWDSSWENSGESTWDSSWENSGESTWDSSWENSGESTWDSSWENSGDRENSSESTWDSSRENSGNETWDYNVDGYWDNTLDPNWQNTWENAQDSWSQATVTTVDFDWLQSVNPDIYAWIEIPGTEISFPVLQDSSDINRYLRRFYDGSYSIVGSIFSAPGSAKDFSDYNTVLYGHNFGNSYMFGDLRDYSDESFMRSYPDIMIYTPYATLTYRIFGAVSYSDVLLSSAFNFGTHYGREQFLNSLSEVRDWNSHVLDDVAVSADDQILVLSTCTNNGDDRYLVTAVLRNIS